VRDHMLTPLYTVHADGRRARKRCVWPGANIIPI
jgi:hypothetical protein